MPDKTIYDSMAFQRAGLRGEQLNKAVLGTQRARAKGAAMGFSMAFEPGYVEAIRTGTVPESTFGKTMLGLETAADLIPGAKLAKGAIAGMALPFAYIKKLDNVSGNAPSAGLTNLTVRTENTKKLVPPQMEHRAEWHDLKYMPEDQDSAVKFYRDRANDRHQRQVNQVTEMKQNELIENHAKTIDKQWRKDVRAMDPALRPDFPIDLIDTMRPSDLSVYQHPNSSLKILTDKARKNFFRGMEEINTKIESGEIKRLYGHRDASKTLRDFIKTRSTHQANKALGPQLSGGLASRERQARQTTDRLRDDWIDKADDPSDADKFMYRDPHDFNYHGWYNSELNHLDAVARKATFPWLQQAKAREIKNALQEAGDYTGKQMPKGTGEQAETIRFMEEQMGKGKGKNIGFRYAQNRGMFV